MTTPEREGTDAIWAAMPGAAPLFGIFGHWPTLHDANIRSVALDWEARSLTVVLDYNDLVLGEAQERSESARITVRWSGVRRLEMTSYGENLYGVTFHAVGDGIETRFTPYAWGSWGAVVAQSVEVLAVERDFLWPEGDENHTVHFTAG